MKHLFVVLSLCTAVGHAQESTLYGIVSVFNSKFETGKTQYVANAAVDEALGRAQAATTTADGTFKLPLVGIRPKSSFDCVVKKEGYEVINTDQLRAVAGQLDALRIFMAPKGKIAENKRQYYRIGKTASEQALARKIAQKKELLGQAQQNRTNDMRQIEALEKEIADLEQRYQTIDQQARELAERFARVNLDDASELYQRAFRYFQKGNIDSALVVLNEVNWEARVDSILAEGVRLCALQQLIQHNDSVIAQRRDTLAAAIAVQVQAHLALRQFREALRASETQLQLYAHDASGLANAYRAAAWLALLAQEYAVAKHYATQVQRLVGESAPEAERYLTYAWFFLGDLATAQNTMALWGKNTAARRGAMEELAHLERAGLPAVAQLRNLLE